MGSKTDEDRARTVPSCVRFREEGVETYPLPIDDPLVDRHAFNENANPFLEQMKTTRQSTTLARLQEATGADVGRTYHIGHG